MALILNRRRLILFGCMATLGVLAGGAFLTRRETLDAFLDTIIPRDEYGPSATDIGLTAQVLSASDRNYWRKIELEIALIWLNAQARGSFATASENDRNSIVSEMAHAGSVAVLWKAYNFVRTICMQHYYADAERAVALGFVGPPQPAGHAAPEKPWSGSASG